MLTCRRIAADDGSGQFAALAAPHAVIHAEAAAGAAFSHDRIADKERDLLAFGHLDQGIQRQIDRVVRNDRKSVHILAGQGLAGLQHIVGRGDGHRLEPDLLAGAFGG